MLPSLERLAAAYRGVLGGLVARVLLTASLAGVVVAGLGARIGTGPARALAATGLLLLVAACVQAFRKSRSWQTSEEGVIRTVLLPAQAEFGGRVLRALRLVERPPELGRGQSPELARLHYHRLLDRSDLELVRQGGRAKAQRLRWAYWVTLAAIAGALGLVPFRVFEGLNVLFAHAGRAPLETTWLESVVVSSRPPAYLGLHATQLMMQSASALPEGSVVSVRGRPLHQDRQIVLTDGVKELPFVDDGTGSVVAHWELTSSVELRVAARFGEVLVFEPDVLELGAQPDAVPVVVLEGAPREIDLALMQQLQLRWSASDDHALAQVDLVLRSGGKEERRPLEHFSSDQDAGTGGHVLFPSDPFLQRVFLPVTARIEARDNDSRGGSKWGVSEAFTLRPTVPGAPEVARYQALASVRDDLVRFLSEQYKSGPAAKTEPGARPKPPSGGYRERLAATKALESESISKLSKTYSGLDVPRGWVPFTRAQFQRLEHAIERHQDEIQTAERVVLAIDAGLASLGNRDAGEVAKRLGDVADEAALGARLAQQSEAERAPGRDRLKLAVSVLLAGAPNLQKLGALGRDLGSVALADLGRVTRSIDTADFFHAELAALHLAARLHRPTPSFSSKGGGGGGVESGPSQGSESGDKGSEGDSASDADAEFDRLAHDLEQLAQEHADGLERTASAMDAAERGLDDQALNIEARRRAEQLRRAVVALPQPGEDPGTSGASAALAREHTGAMAHELERLALERAVENGNRARGAAEEALRRGDLDSSTEELLRSTLRELSNQINWAEQESKRRAQATEQAARSSLNELSKLERELSERARRLASEESAAGQKSKLHSGIPDETKARLGSASRLMDEAARLLESGKGDQAVDLQRQAQRLLEESETGETQEPAESQDKAQAGAARPSSGGGDVPSADRRNSAEDFRKRVLEGLGKRGSGPLSGATKRYAEGLLR